MGTENQHIDKAIYKFRKISKQTKKVAKKINEKYNNEELIIIAVSKGALPYMAELIKHLKMDVSIDLITAKSYSFDKKLHKPKIKYDKTIDIKDKNILVIEDLIDSGETLMEILTILKQHNPKNISITALFAKDKGIAFKEDQFYVFNDCPKEFLIGFGLDYDEKYRNLPYIAKLKK